MRNRISRPADRTTSQTSPKEPTEQTVIFDNKNYYKKFPFFKCYCGTCGSLNDEQIAKIYSSNLIIAENNSQIFNVFTEHVQGY